MEVTPPGLFSPEDAMANEITLTASLTAYKAAVMQTPGFSLAVTDQQSDMAGNFFSTGTILVPANLSGTITGATNANPIVLTTSAAHHLVTGDSVTTLGVLGNTAANTTAIATVLSTTTFSIPVTGNGAYTSGGTFTTANGIALPLGQVTAPHWSWFYNLDAANYVQLRNGQAGAVLGRLLAGEQSPFPLDASATPWALANTSAVLLEYLILSA